MKKRNSTKSFVLTISALLLVVAFVPTNFAQSQTPAPQLYYVQVIKTNPGMGNEWREFYKNEILPVLKKGGAKQSTVLATSFGDTRDYIIIAPLESLARLDEPNLLVKALGQEAARALNMKQSRLLAEWHIYISQSRPDLGIAPTSTEPAKLAVMVRQHVTPGRALEFKKWAKENPLLIAKKINAKGVLTGKTLMGGDPNTYTTFILYDSYADISKYQTEMVKAAAEMKLSLVAPAGLVAHTETLVVRDMPELSIRPAPQKAENK